MFNAKKLYDNMLGFFIFSTHKKSLIFTSLFHLCSCVCNNDSEGRVSLCNSAKEKLKHSKDSLHIQPIYSDPHKS